MAIKIVCDSQQQQFWVSEVEVDPADEFCSTKIIYFGNIIRNTDIGNLSNSNLFWCCSKSDWLSSFIVVISSNVNCELITVEDYFLFGLSKVHW